MQTLIRISRIQLPQGQIFGREGGEGSTLVFLHGSFQDGTQWLPLVETLTQHYHCVVPDLLGFGDSDVPEQPQSIALQAESLAAYLEALRLENYVLVAHSLGAWVASHYALTQPSQLRGMVLLSPEGLKLEAFPQRWQREQQLTATLPVRPAALKLAGLLKSALGERRRQAIATQRAYRQKLLASPASCQLLFKRRSSTVQDELLDSRLANLQVPVRVLQGGQDNPIQIAQSQLYAQLAPNARLRLFQTSGADLIRQCPESVTSEIQQFVESTRVATVS